VSTSPHLGEQPPCSALDSGAIALGATALLGSALATPALAATDSEIPTFQQFASSTFKDTDQQYIATATSPSRAPVT
jgi:hypothetical protein